MDVFISWAGKRSLAVAEALKDWIPMVVNAAKPWLSKAQIPSGRLWRVELAESLSNCKFGIFCLTPNSIQSHWMFFEAGAISKTLADSYVCPLLIDLRVSDVVSPFADFQCRTANKDGIFALMQTLNAAMLDGVRIPEAQLRSVFDLLWPALEAKLARLPLDDGEPPKERNTTEILEEILSRVRALERGVSENATQGVLPENTSSGVYSREIFERLHERLTSLFPSLRFRLKLEPDKEHLRVTAIDADSLIRGRTTFSCDMPLSAMIAAVTSGLASTGIFIVGAPPPEDVNSPSHPAEAPSST